MESSGRRTLRPARRRPSKACGDVTSWMRWRSTKSSAGSPGGSATTWLSQILSNRVLAMDLLILPHVRLPSVLEITVGGFTFEAQLEEEAAPKTIAALRRLLPLESKLLQARWSGEAAWVPMGLELDLGL